MLEQAQSSWICICNWEWKVASVQDADANSRKTSTPPALFFLPTFEFLLKWPGNLKSWTSIGCFTNSFRPFVMVNFPKSQTLTASLSNSSGSSVTRIFPKVSNLNWSFLKLTWIKFLSYYIYPSMHIYHICREIEAFGITFDTCLIYTLVNVRLPCICISIVDIEVQM